MSTGLLVLALLICIVVPFFSDLMNIYSSIGIFTLSFSVPAIMYLMVNGTTLSSIGRAAKYIIIVVALTGCVLGVWAACTQIRDDWRVCNYKIEF